MLEVKQLFVNYRGLVAVENISFCLTSGQIVGIIGPNGAGKSTLLRAILGLIPVEKGVIKFQSCSVAKQLKQIAYIPQRAQIDWDYPITKELLFYTFNPLGAKAIGLPVKWLNLVLVSAITLTIVASMKAVGVVLVVSLLIAPSITAYLLVKELHQMMILGAVFGGISGIIGIYLSYYLNVPSGAAIVLVGSILFLLVLLFSPTQGILTRL